MELFVAINTTTMDVILISDKKELVEEKIRSNSESHDHSNCQICSTGNVKFSSGFTAEISYAYDLQCLEETIHNRLFERRIDADSPQAKSLLSILAADAYHDIMHYDVSEDYAIEETFRLHLEELNALPHLPEETGK